MLRSMLLRAVAVSAVVVSIALPALGAISYTSNATGYFDDVNSWSPSGHPGVGDSVTIQTGHTITVRLNETVDIVNFDPSSGGTLVVDGATLNVEATGAALTLDAVSSTGTHQLTIQSGGIVSVPNGDVAIQGGAGDVSRLSFSTGGGTLTVAGNLTFTGVAANAQLDFPGNSGVVDIGGDLGDGGTITSGGSTFNFNGGGAQTINSYTFDHFKINKSGGTATLAAAIAVNGDFRVESGVLDDGGYAIALNPALTSAIYIGSTGVLKLGSSVAGTSFPGPYNAANVTLDPGSAVVYQAGVAQTIDTSFSYQNLWLTTLAGAVNRTIAFQLDVLQDLTVNPNVTLDGGSDTVDVDGNITGGGTIGLTNGILHAGGNFDSAMTLVAGSGSEVVYDGTGAQNVLGTTYWDLTIDKSSGTATLTGNATVDDDFMNGVILVQSRPRKITSHAVVASSGTFDAGANTITFNGDFSNDATVTANAATFIFSGSLYQNWNSGSNITVANLTINNAAGVAIGSDTTVTGSLNLTQGKVDVTGSFFVDVLASVNRTNGWITGPLTMGLNPTPARRFVIGTGTAYLPVDVDSGSAGFVTIQAVEAQQPNRTGDNVLDRYWTISAGSATPLDTLVFNYNATDVTTGTESQYVLAQYDGSAWTSMGDVVNETTHVATLTNVSSYIGDWVAGQLGSVGYAGKLAITSVNAGSDPTVNQPFDVVVESQDDNGNARNVTSATTVTLSVLAGAGAVGGSTAGTIAAGTNSVTISGVTYDTAESGVVLRATASGGDALGYDDSNTFNVGAAPTVLTVTSINDSGPGTLRDAITTANTGGCATTCTIEFSTSGTILLSTALPAITVDNLTIDGYTAPGASANTNAFGLPSNAVITVALDGGNSVAKGLEVQGTFVHIKGLAIRNFTGDGVYLTGDNSGSSVSGCSIGTDNAGLTAAGNGANAIHLESSTEASVGGFTPDARNVIGGQASGNGILVDGTSNTITIAGNYVGVKADLTGALANQDGIEIGNGTSSVAVGASGTGNVVGGSTGTGVILLGGGAAVESNIIGPAGTSTAAIPNQEAMFIVATATNSVIGGTVSPSQKNVVSGNIYGISLEASSTTLDQNVIGLAPDGTTPMGNSVSGIRIFGTASNNTIGGTVGNTIANNGNGVVFVAGTTGIGNAIRKNKIYGNTSLAIDLNEDGITANDALDADTGPNNLQNFPTIAQAQISGGNLAVQLSLDSSSGVSVSAVRFDVYKADASATPQASDWIGDSGCLAGNVFANTVFTVPQGSLLSGNKIVVTATAYGDGACTSVSEGTSELSAAAAVSSVVHWNSGVSGSWETGSNWDGGVVPAVGDDVYIDAAGTYSVSLTSAANVKSLHVGAASGAQTLQLNPGASLAWTNASSIDTNGIVAWNGNAAITGSGGLTIDGTLQINNADTRVLEQLVTVNAAGSVDWTNGTVYLQNGGGFDNYGTFDILGDNTFSDGGSDAGFDNFGTFRKSVTPGTTTFAGVDFTNSGTMDIQTGWFNPSTGSSTGSIALASGAELSVDSLTFTLSGSGNVTGAGKIHLTGGTLTVNSNVTINNIALDGGTINGSSGFTLGGQFAWTQGAISGSGTLALSPATAAMTLTGTNTKSLDGRTLSVATGTTLTLGGTGTFSLQNGGNIAVLSGGTFELAGDATIADNGSDGGIDNAGLLKKSAGTLTTITGVDVTNSGIVRIASGTLSPTIMTSTGTIDLLGGDLNLDLGDQLTLDSGSDVMGAGTLHVSGGTLTANVADGIPNLDFSAGTITGTGALSCTACTWSGGVMQGSGTTTIPSAATLTLSGSGTKQLARTLAIANGGSASFGGTNFAMLGGGAINNAGSMSIVAPIPFTDNGSAGDLTNSGTLAVNTAGTVTLSGITLFNSGTLDLQGGTLDLADGSSSGPISLAGTTTLLVNSDTYTLSAGCSVSGSGTLSLTAGGTLDAGTNVAIPSFSLSGGTLTGIGIVSLTGTADWSSGSMTGGGTTTVAGTGTLSISSASSKMLSNRTLSTQAGGVIDVTGSGALLLQSGGAISNFGQVNLTADAPLTNNGGAGNLTNSGTWSKTTTTGTTLVSNLNFTNSGLLDLQSGILAVSGGTFSQSGGTFKSTLNGTTAGSGFGQLTTSGAPSLSGTLQIALQGVYQPVGGDTFRVLSITGGTHAGDFTTDSYAALSGGRTFSRAYDAAGLLLTVNGQADVTITKSAPSAVVVGNPISYTLTVNNASTDVATGVSVSDTLPAGHTGISAWGTGWNCSVAGSTVTCSATSSLPTGNANAITINATAPATAQTFINTATVSSTNDSNSANNDGTATVTVNTANADLTVGGTAPAGPVATGTPVTFTFNVTNSGPQVATNVVFTASIPSTLTFNSATFGASACTFASQTVTCPATTLNASTFKSASINLTTAAAGTQTITGSVTANEPDANAADNSLALDLAVTGSVVTVTNNADSGTGSLRQALLDAQNGVCTSPCTIAFAINPPFVITPLTSLPSLAGNATLDATTQSGYAGTPVVQLDGGSLNLVPVLTLGGSGAKVKGLAIANAHTAIDVTGNNNTVEACLLGLDTTGNAGAGTNGILISGDGNTIGGTTAAQRNVISGNSQYGVVVQSTASGNTISGNFIGTNIAGTSARANGIGVYVTGSASNTTLDDNVISGNSSRGVSIAGGGATVASAPVASNALILVSNTTITNNFIGVDPSGTALGNGGDGITVDSNATGTVIGANGQGNVISANGSAGIRLNGTNVDATTIRANLIGVAPNGTTAMGNGIGIVVDGATNSTIGGTGAGVLNTIANNGATGVDVVSGSGAAIAGNSIFNHSALGIDLGDDGATANDAGDADTGANNLQNKPVLASAELNSGSLTATFALDSTAGSTLIELFEADSLASGEGKTPLGRLCFTGGALSTTMTVPAGSAAIGDPIVATATTYSDLACTTVAAGTSEFSSPVTATACTPPPVTITGPTASCAGAPVTLDAGSGYTSYNWSTGATTQTITVSPASTQTYSVIVTNGIGCSNTDSHTVTVSAAPTTTITTAAQVCTGSSGNNAAVPAQAGAAYTWSVTNGTLDSGQGTSAITYTAASSGSVGISIAITSGSCTTTGSTSVPISAPPSVTITGPASVCPHTSFTLDAGAGYDSYQWSNGATTRTITLDQSAASATYSVIVTSNGCSATDSHVVTLLAGPQAEISAPNSAAPNSAHTATVLAQAGAAYHWSIVNGSITSGQNSDAITFTTGASGQTKLTVTVSAGGCSMTDTHFVSITGGATTADLAITKTAVATALAGANLTYIIGITNHGPANANGVSIVDTFPAGTTLVSFDDGPWTCSPTSGSLLCSGSAAAGASSTITLVLQTPQQEGVITNGVTISASNDANTANNTATATTTLSTPSPACATVPPALVSPADGASTTSPVTFQWTAVSGAAQYEVWIDSILAGSTAGTSFASAVSSGNHSWFVVAQLASGCDPLTSAQRTFSVAEGSNCASHGAPLIAAPQPGATLVSPVTFSWMPVPQAIGYRVWIEVDGTAAQDIGTTDGAISLTAVVPKGAVVAWVDALFGGCPDTRSASVAFTVNAADECATHTAATLVAPANNATLATSAVDFQWLAAPNADGYRVWASIDGGVPVVLGTTTADTTLHATIPNGSVVWWVEALYDGCASVDSAPRSFTIPPAEQCGTAIATNVAPAAGSVVTDGNVQFAWTAVPNALQYELWLALDNGTPALAGTTTSTSLTSVVAPGTIEWFVRAIIDRCPPRDSQPTTFTFQLPAACAANQRAVAIAPLDGARMTAPVELSWTAPAGATRYEVYTIRGGQAPALLASTTASHTGGINLPNGKLRWFVRTFFGDDCPPLDATEHALEIVPAPAACATLAPPVISAPGQVSSGTPFTIQWTPSAGATSYQLQLAARSDFDDAQTIITNATLHQLTRSNDGAEAIALYARVRAIDSRCQPSPTVTPYGPVSAIFILPPSGRDGSVPTDGNGLATFSLRLGPELAGQTFAAAPKQTWLSVSPSSGVVAQGGTTLVVTANMAGLPLGTSLGGIVVSLSAPSSGRTASNATTVIVPSFSVNLVTPVVPQPKNTPPPDALIIPAVAHADGINSKFQSDVRVSNTSPQLVKYQLTFTPSGTSGITAGQQTTFSIEPGRTIALDDILKSWFGTGTTSTTGTLEIRPLTQVSTSTSSSALTSGLSNLLTFASSRTFNATSNGTFGQYIPAVPFANFIGSDALRRKVISLQQIAQSDRYRTNLGIVEGSGEPASLLVKVFGDTGQKLTEFPVNLSGGQHVQLNGFLSSNGITSLNDGRVEIEVTSPGGKVTAYASVLDNVTSDPLLVTPVQLTDEGNTKWVMPGVADLDNGFANWRTDMRVFNAGTADVDATLAFYSQNGGAPKLATITIPAGQVRQFDRTVSTLFGATNDGGAVHITTAAPARLIATARTYNQTTGGTYGQFISAVTPNESASLGSRPLQILQVEESDRFRSNIGLAEVTGNPVRIEIAVVPPDSKFTAVAQLTLNANEFRQIGSLLKSVGLSDTYNARVTVRVLEGTGRVTAYASVIDAITNDPTYIPAQ